MYKEKLRAWLLRPLAVLLGVAGLAGPGAADAAIERERQLLDARVEAVRQMLQAQNRDSSSYVPAAPSDKSNLAQWLNWNNWNNWVNWNNWPNWFNR